MTYVTGKTFSIYRFQAIETWHYCRVLANGDDAVENPRLFIWARKYNRDTTNRKNRQFCNHVT